MAVDFALAAAALEPRPAESPAAVLLPSLLESEQLDACGHGGGYRKITDSTQHFEGHVMNLANMVIAKMHLLNVQR